MPSKRIAPRPVCFRDYSRRSQLRIAETLRKLGAGKLSQRPISTSRQFSKLEVAITKEYRNLSNDSEHRLCGNETSSNDSDVEEDPLKNSYGYKTAEETPINHDFCDEREDEQWVTSDDCGESSASNEDRDDEKEAFSDDADEEDSIGDEGELAEDIIQDDSRNSDNENNVKDQEQDSPLYPGARITVGASLLAILALFVRYSFSGACLADILNLVELHCMQPNSCRKSLYAFKKYFENIYAPLRRRFYCDSCFDSLRTDKSQCENCLDKTKVAYFIEIPLVNQLQTLYKRPGFIEQLQYRFTRTKQNPNFYEDIYDGNVYQEFCQPGKILSDLRNISFMWNTDGVSVFKSSRYSIWPFFLSINELPYHQRTKKENLLLGGLWFGSSKPFPPLFLHFISEEMQTLKNGVNLEVPSFEDPVRVRAIVICGTCDAPAKALFLNMKQFNGENGCQKCEAQSETCGVKNLRIYPFERNLKERTQEETDRFAVEAVQTGEAPKGVKGPSAISGLSSNYIRTTAIDVMHCVFLGLVQNLLVLWFSSTFKNKPWSLSKFKRIVDLKVCAMTPPTFVTRLPRSIIANLNYLKASELKVWFFYYSLPILKSIMLPTYFEHYQLFVNAIYILSGNSISYEMVNLANEFIIEFVSRFSDLYERRHMSSNLHLLRHLPATVCDFGPLWVTSCFAFENVNGQIKALVRGTRFAGLQISMGLSYFMALPELIEKVEHHSDIYKFCDRLCRPQRKFKSHEIRSNLHIVGTIKTIINLSDTILHALESSNFMGANLGVFYRLIKEKSLYTSTMYRRCTKTNSSCAKFIFNGQINFGIINCFIRVSNCLCKKYCNNIECNSQYCAIIRKCITYPRFNSNFNGNRTSNENFSGIYECILTDTLIAINIDDLRCICFFLAIPNGPCYIAEPANSKELE